MQAVCVECGREWELQKRPDDYKDGPRCPETSCGSRDVEVTEPEDPDTGEEPLATRAFRRFREGDSPLDLVEAGVCGPDEARRLRDEFNELAEGKVVMISEAELAERVEEAREEERMEAERRVRDVRESAQSTIGNLRQKVDQLEASLFEQYQAGYEEGRKEAETELREEYEERVEQRIEELRRDHRRRLKQVREEAGRVAEEAIADREAEIERLRAVIDERDETIAALKNSDEAHIWADGFDSGVRVGSKEGQEAGKLDGMAIAIETFSA